MPARNDRGNVIDFVRHTCIALNHVDGLKRLDIWQQSHTSLLNATIDAYQDFVSAEEVFSQFGFDYQEFCVELATWSLMNDQGPTFQRTSHNIAEKTGLVAFRFLSAWSLLNMDHLEECYEECAKVVDPHGPVLTLKGQVLLELGRAKEAEEVLEDATDVAPDEILGWFQLAKCYSVQDNEESCWNALIQCQRLQPRNLEVAAFLSLTALKNDNEHHLRYAWNTIAMHKEQLFADGMGAEILIDLCLALKDHDNLEEIVKHLNWSRVTKDKLFLNRIPQWIGEIERQNRSDLASRFKDYERVSA